MARTKLSPRFTLQPRGRYALAASRAFLEGFTPAAGNAVALGARLALAFRLDAGWRAGGVVLEQDAPDAEVRGTVTAGDPAAVQRQVARMLGLDHDGRGWDEVGRRDPVIGALQARYAGFRAVSFASPYEAAVWGILAQRVSMKQAAGVRRRIATALGDALDVGGATMHVFPAPATIRDAGVPEGVTPIQWTRLQAIAGAAIDGTLDAAALLATPDARARLGALPGVGPWTASHILVRGTGATDLIAFEEPRVRAAVRHAYGLPQDPRADCVRGGESSDTRRLRRLGEAELASRAEAWRPFRTWAIVLLAMHLARTGEWRVDRGRARRGR